MYARKIQTFFIHNIMDCGCASKAVYPNDGYVSLFQNLVLRCFSNLHYAQLKDFSCLVLVSINPCWRITPTTHSHNIIFLLYKYYFLGLTCLVKYKQAGSHWVLNCCVLKVLSIFNFWTLRPCPHRNESFDTSGKKCEWNFCARKKRMWKEGSIYKYGHETPDEWK